MAKRTRKKKEKTTNRIYLLSNYTLVINEIESGEIYTVKYKGIYYERKFTAKRNDILVIEETQHCKLKGWIEFDERKLINIDRVPIINNKQEAKSIIGSYILNNKLYLKQKGNIIKGQQYKIIYNQKKVRKVKSNNSKQLIIRPTKVYEHDINTIMYIGKSDTVFKLSTFPIIQS